MLSSASSRLVQQSSRLLPRNVFSRQSKVCRSLSTTTTTFYKRVTLQHVHQSLQASNSITTLPSSCHKFIRLSSSVASNSPYPLRVTIGSTWKDVSEPKQPAYVPTLYYSDEVCSQTERAHMQWMLKKDLLGQDMFLIGPPGPMRRRLAMTFAEITSREVEYISLSRDTTESDMKQRREVMQKTAQYIDQSAVRAATDGRLLIIEGIEKAERNVLPLINNLLENREMHLEDGRHLISAERYDKLIVEHGAEVLDKWKLVRVNENFRVIALGLPVPFFKGNPLDPPLRSRFQANSVVPLTAAVTSSD